MKWNYFFFRFAASCTCFFFTGNSIAQVQKEDSDFYRSALVATVRAYHLAIGDQSELFNGTLYPGYPFLFKNEVPFFNPGGPDTGSVCYDNIRYTGLPLYYDDLSQVVLTDDNGYKIRLNNKKIEGFSINAHHFIPFGGKAKGDSELYPGFYELIYAGGIRILKKRIRKMTDYISGNEISEKWITDADRFYIEKDSAFYAVENQKDITTILADKKKEILQFIKKNKLHFRKDMEQSLSLLAPFYDQLRKAL